VSVLRTAWAAGPLVLALWAVELVVAAAAGGAVRAMTTMAMNEYALPPDGRLLLAIAELGEIDPALRAGLGASLVASLVLGLVLWTVLTPLLVVWMQGTHDGTGRDGLVVRWARSLGGVVATTAWHLLLRVVLLVVLVTSLGPLPRSVAAGSVVLVVLVCGAALDVARVQVIVHGARGTSVRTALAAFVQLLRRPGPLAVLAVLHLGQWLLAGVVLAIALRTGGSAPWAARGVALAAVSLAAIRLAVALGMGPLPMRGPASPRAGDGA